MAETYSKFKMYWRTFWRQGLKGISCSRYFERELTPEEIKCIVAWMDDVNRKFSELSDELAKMPEIK